MNDDRDKWNSIYRGKRVGLVSETLREHIHLLPRSGRALDLACGLGANSFFLSELGLDVEAWDISDEAIAQINLRSNANAASVVATQVDIQPGCLGRTLFDLIIVSKFLDRQLFAELESALKPGGLLFVETFTQSRIPGAGGPGNPAFLLEQNELLKIFAHMNVLTFRDEQLVGDASAGKRNLSHIIVQKQA